MFDGQVVRLEKLKDVADKFVRVRLTRVDNLDLNLFEFDYDLTFMVFFLDAQERVYARYGGRDAESADSRQSLDGLAYTMRSVLEAHGREDKAFAAKSGDAPKYLRDIAGGLRGGRCMHCHQVKEAINADLSKAGKWTRELAYKFPLPETLGLTLDVDRGNVVKAVAEKSPAAAAGLKPGDVLRRLGEVPVHSIADAQLALDRAPATGALPVAWERGGAGAEAKLALAEGWRRADVSWRPSLRHLVPMVRLYGTDLTAEEKKALGLPAARLAFRQRDSVPAQAKEAGVRGGDVILGVDGARPETDVIGFLRHVQGNYLIGDTVTVNVLRDGKRVDLPMKLLR